MPKLTATRRQALDEMMRDAIFDAVTAVLAEHGVAGMTMDRVARAAEVAKGSLYHYFPSKKAIIEFVYMKMIDPLCQNLEEIVATQQPAVKKLAAHLGDLLEQVARHSQVFKLLFQDDTARGILRSSQRRTHEAISERLAQLFRQGISEGAFRPAEPLVLAHMFLGLCRGIFDTHPELEGPNQREQVHRLIMGTFLNGIATEPCRPD